MKNISYNNKEYIVFNDSEIIDLESLDKNDKDFLIKESLIKFKSFTEASISFVGEVLTPSTNFLTLPKNLSISDKTINITLKMLSEFKSLKRDNKTLFTNKSFSPNKNGELKSEQFYFNKLLKFFLDYITYEFYYDKERKHIHSTHKLNGYVQPMKTNLNNEQFGPGVTYKVKNKEETIFGNIYYSTLKDLSEKYASDRESKQIKDMLEYLNEEDYTIKYTDISDEDRLKEILKTEVDDIHQPIKKTLIDYYENKNITDITSIYAFYSSKFQYVWEFFTQKVLKHSNDFEKHFGKMVKPARYKVYEEYIQDEPEYKNIRPDIFSKNGNKLFIGDAKYYNKITSDYDKEQYQYNIAFENKYPMIIFAPSIETKYYTKYTQKYRDEVFELLIFKISVSDVILDVLNKTTITLDKIYNILPQHTKRQFIF